MKKYLLLILSMLSVSIGTWADPTNFGSTSSTWEVSGTVLTVYVDQATDFSNVWQAPAGSTTSVNKLVVTAREGLTLTCGTWDSPLAKLNSLFGSIPILDLSQVTVSMASDGKLRIVDWGKSVPTNVIVPSAYSANPTGVVIEHISNETTYPTNNYSISGTEVLASLGNTSNLRVLSDINAAARTLKLAGDISGAINLTTVITESMADANAYTIDLSNVTTAATYDSNEPPACTNKISIDDNVDVYCTSSGVRDRVDGPTGGKLHYTDPNITCTVEGLQAAITALGGVSPTSVTFTEGTLSDDAITILNNNNISLTRIDMRQASVGSANLNNLTLSSVEELVLPAGTTPEVTFTALTTLKSNVIASSTLKYVYAPYSGTQDKDQMVADYVWVNKPGGLSKAFDEQTRLLSAWYMIVESTVALNDDDVNFWGSGSTARPMQYRYLDLSGANITPAVLANYKVTDNLPYRIILPNDWTGDDMAVFAANPNCGNIAAVYSYTGTDHKRLDILELHDKAYMTTALNNPRIVRSGTTSIRVVSGHYGSNPVYAKLGKNLLAAINGAASTITSVTIAVGSGIYTLQNEGQENVEDVLVSTPTTFAFTNTNLTELIMNYINNSNLTVDVHSCTNLQSLSMNEVTLAGIVANGITSLTTASLGHATVGGDVNLSGTKLTSLLEVDQANITGTLDVSNTSATSFDFTQLTAIKVDASNTNALTSLNINGISLNGDEFTPNDDTQKDGKIDVTRSSNNYSGLTITKADAFNATRIIPSTGGYTTISIHEAKVEITVEGNSLTDEKVDYAVATYNTAHDSDPGYTAGTKANVKVLHVTGKLTADDITYIKNNLTALQLLDLSGCEFASGVSVSNITSAPIPTSTAIVLPDLVPGESNTEASTIAVVKTLQDAGYECVAYYTSKTAGNYRLNVYAYNGTIGNLISSEPAIVNSYTSITFLRKYQNTDVSSTAHEYPQATPSLLTALSKMSENLGIPSVDMTWLDISKLGTDFSGLNSYLIIIPQNSTAEEITRNGITYNNDFTVEDDTDKASETYTPTHVSTASYKYYKYHWNTYAVSTYKSNVAPYAANAYFGGDALSYDNGFGHKNTTATLLYLRDDNNLGSIIEYMPDHMKNAHILSIVGTINENGVEFGLNKMTNPCIDLTRATISDISILNSLDNDYVQSISIPYKTVTNLNATPANDEYGLSDLPQLSKTACTNLKGVGLLVKSNDIASGSSSKKGRLIYKSYEEGGMANQMLMLHALNQVNREYVISRMVIGGPVNARDISVRDNGIDMNGHLATIVTDDGKMTAEATTFWDAKNGNQIYGSLSGYANIEWWDFSKVTLPTYTSMGEKGWKKKPNTNPTEWENAGVATYAFSNETHSYGDSGSSFSYQNDLCYTELGIAPATSMMDEPKLPTDPSVWRLVDHALDNCHLLQNICLPWNYQYLGDGALWGTILQHITTTDGSGNLIDNGDNTYTLSANLKELGNKPSGEKDFVSACVFPQNRPVYDCYALATTTPKCYRGVFPANMYYGWGGFQGAGFPYCRDKYKNGDNYFTVLRYPYRDAWLAAHPSPARQTDMEFEEDEDEPMAGVQKAPASRRTQQGQVNPDNSYEEMKMAYTDVTKNYTKKEQTGAVDANGDEIIWPTFSELRRAYNQASNNVTWNNWKATYDINHDVEQGSAEIPLAASTVNALGTGDHTTTDRGEGNTDGDPYAFQYYEGWHQFTLSQATYVEPDYQNAKDREYVQAGWYTFCIPFDMTEDQVYEMLGVPYSTAQYTNKVGTDKIKHVGQDTEAGIIDRILPEIVTLEEVIRTPGNTKNIIQLRMTGNLAEDGSYKYLAINNNTGGDPTQTLTDCGTNGDGKKIVIKGGYPYYIRPYLLKSDVTPTLNIKNLGKYVMSRYGDKFKQTASCANTNSTMEYLGDKSVDQASWLATLKFAKPFEGHKIQALHNETGNTHYAMHKDGDQDSSNDKKYYYTFIGQFWDQPLPQYCYYTLEGRDKWYRFTKFDSSTAGYTWSAYKCVILVTQEVDDTATHPTSGKFRNNETGHSNYPTVRTVGTQNDLLDGTLKIEFLDGIDDYDFVNSARECIFLFDEDIIDFDPDGQATAIEVLDGERIAPVRGKVYNMAGQYVGNSIEGLSKGMYIVNGKKYVIK